MLSTCLLPFFMSEKVFYVLGILIKFENWSLEKKKKTNHLKEVKHLFQTIASVPDMLDSIVFLEALTCLLLAGFLYFLKASFHVRRQL